MKVYRKVYFGNDNSVDTTMLVGEPTDKDEFEKMFKLRYEIYSAHGYIDGRLYPDGLEKDEYDLDGKSKYFIAMVGRDVVGSLRIIQDYYLPTEKDCFEFDEPDVIKKIPRDHRAELGRLIAKKYKVGNHFLPRHLTLLSLVGVASEFGSKNGIDGGYAFIKSSLEEKLEKLMIPFHKIEPYKEIYTEGVLKPYFNQKDNLVMPIYFLSNEVNQYFDRMSKFGFLLVRVGEDEYRFKKIRFLTFLLWRILGRNEVRK